MRILGIAGSLRAGSFNKVLLRAAAGALPASVKLTPWRGLRRMPPFSEDDEDDPPAAVRRLRTAIAASDGVLVATPEYNGSIPGQLKNTLDWASRPFPDNVLRDKPVAVIGASPSPSGAGRAQAETRTVLTRIGARVVDGEVTVPHAFDQFDHTGRLADSGTIENLQTLLDDLTGAVVANEPHAGSLR